MQTQILKLNGQIISRMKSSLPLLTSASSVIFIFRDYFFNRSLPGDLGDGRAYVVYVSHWYEFILGKVPLRDTSFFWPAKDSLGSTDPLLAQGILSIPLRLMGVSLVTTSILVTMLLALIGFYGCFKFLEVVTRNIPLAVAGTWLMSFSYNFNAQLGHPQIIAGFPLLFVVLYHGYLFWNIQDPRKKSIQFQLMCSWILLLSLTSWYALMSALVTALVIGVVIIFAIGLGPYQTLRVKLHSVLSGCRNFQSLLISSFSLTVFGLWIYIYLPYIREDVTGWAWSEVAYYGPRWGDVLNTSVGATGTQAQLNEFFQLAINPTFERAMGIPLVLAILATLLGLFCLREGYRKLIPSKILFTSAWILILLTTFDERGQSVWWVVWKYIPGASSIRAVGRIRIVIAWVLILAILICLSHLLSRINRIQYVSICFIFLLLILESARSSQSFWKSEDFLPVGSEKVISKLVKEECAAFLIVSRKKEQFDVFAQYDAMAISAISGIPTLNGSSGKTPDGWNFYDWETEMTDINIQNWMKKNGQTDVSSVCKVMSLRIP
jgi:hypothetical protein